jgi:hypothetical protein
MSTTTRSAEPAVSYFAFLPTLMEEQAHTDPGVLDDTPAGHLLETVGRLIGPR